MIGQTISHYDILEKLGEGGMGVIYKAKDTTLDRIVALKFLPHYLTSDKTERERFYHEARAASSLNHPNITTIHEIQEFNNQIYLAMELIEGMTLKRLLQEDSLPIKRVLDLAIQSCEGLAAAHDKGIVHRDIKSDNIMVTPKGQVKITDFGLAKIKGASKLTKAGSTLGTAAYMSPEQAQGEEVDQRSDIFSFGVVLYEMLTGTLPFKGEHQAALMYSLINEEPISIARYNDKVTADLERLVSKAMAKDKNERYQHVDDLLADLRRERKNLEYAKAGYASPGTISQVKPPSRRKTNVLKYLVAVSTAVVLVVMVTITNPFNCQVDAQRAAPTPANNSLAVMYFENIPDPEDKEHTGEMMLNLLITSLSQSQGLEVISRERLFDIQKELKADSKSITAEMATRVAQRAGATTMLLGSILQKEPDLAVTIRLIDVKSGKIVSSKRVAGFSSRQIFVLVDTLALLARNDLSVTTYSPMGTKSVKEVTTSSPEAYRSYIEGKDQLAKFAIPEARISFHRAIELDSNFAMAYFELAHVITWDPVGQRTSILKALDLSERITEKERLRIQSYYALQIEHDVSKASKILETIVDKFPHEQGAYSELGLDYNRLGQYEKAMQTLLRGIQSDSLDKTLWNLLAYSYLGMNRGDDALKAINSVIRLAPAEANSFDSKGDIYFALGKVDSAVIWYEKASTFRSDFVSTLKLGLAAVFRQSYEMAEKYFDQFSASPDPWQRLISQYYRLVVPLHRGQLSKTRRLLLDRLSALEVQKLTPDPRQNALAVHAVTDAISGFLATIAYEMDDYPAMVENADRASRHATKGPDDVFYERDLRAWAYAKSGNTAISSKIMEEIDRDVDKRRILQSARYDYTAALIQYEQGKYDASTPLFEKAFRSLYPNHSPQFHYGVSLLKSGRTTDAILELHRVTWWSGVNIFGPFDMSMTLSTNLYFPIASVKAHYWLGVAYEQQGNEVKAIKEYEKFLEIWKDADFKSPEMQDARKRIARLK